MTDEQREDGGSGQSGVTRASFLKASAGAAAGAAAIGVPRQPACRADAARVTEPSVAQPARADHCIRPRRRARRGDRDVGSNETTYRDPRSSSACWPPPPRLSSKRRWHRCPRTVKHPRSVRTRRPTMPTSMRSSAPTARHRDPDQQLRAAPGPARRAELLRVRRRRPLLDLHRQRRRRPA